MTGPVMRSASPAAFHPPATAGLPALTAAGAAAKLAAVHADDTQLTLVLCRLVDALEATGSGDEWVAWIGRLLTRGVTYTRTVTP